jgi:hypothetical protein
MRSQLLDHVGAPCGTLSCEPLVSSTLITERGAEAYAGACGPSGKNAWISIVAE